MSKFERRMQRTKQQRAHKQAVVLHRAGVTVEMAQAAIKRTAKANARAQHSTYPCDVCGRESTFFKKWAPDDLRRRTLPQERRKEATLADTWCWWHAPVQYWPRWRRRTYVVLTFITHPIRFVRVLRLQRAQETAQ